MYFVHHSCKSNNISLYGAAPLAQLSSIFCSKNVFSLALTCKIYCHRHSTLPPTENNVYGWAQEVVAGFKLALAPQLPFIYPDSVTPSGLSCPDGCFWCRSLPGDSAAWCCQTQQTQTGSSQQSPAAEEHKKGWTLLVGLEWLTSLN